MMGHRERTKTGAEWDCVTGWRHVLCYMSNTTAPRKIKKQMTRRNRHADKISLNAGLVA